MTFTMPSYPLLTPQQASPYADLVKNAMQMYGQGVQARYAPQMQQAEIFNKEFAPLAQIASSPLAVAMLPDQKNQMAALISQLLQQTGAPGGQSGGLLGSLFGGNRNIQTNQAMGGGQANQTMPAPAPTTGNNPPAGYNPSLPQAGKSFGDSVTAKVTAPYNEQIHRPGVSFYDPITDKKYSQPNESTVTVSQNSLNAINRTKPQLEDIVKSSKEFLGTGGMIGTTASQLSGIASTWGNVSPETIKEFGIDPEKYSRYVGWHAKIGQAVDSFMGAFPNIPHTDNSMSMVETILTPRTGETEPGYMSRIMQSMDALDRQYSLIQQQLIPIDLTRQSQQPNAAPSNGNQPTTTSNNKQNNPISRQLANSQPAKEEGLAQYQVGGKNRPEGVVQQIKKMKNKTYHKINNIWYPVLG